MRSHRLQRTSELDAYLEIAGVTGLVDVVASSEDAEQSKPAPDIFLAALKKLSMDGHDTVAIGDTPYDAESAGKASITTLVCCVAASPRLTFAEAAVQPYTQDRVLCWLASTRRCLAPIAIEANQLIRVGGLILSEVNWAHTAVDVGVLRNRDHSKA